MVIYVNSLGEASYVGASSFPPQVGPILSNIDGVIHITGHLSISEIYNLRENVYQQVQLPHPKEFSKVNLRA